MESLRLFLTTNKSAQDCGITLSDIHLIRQYKTITVGRRQYETKDVLQQIELCESCCELRLKIKSLEIALARHNQKRDDPPPIQVVLEDYFKKNYFPVRMRVYSRRQLFKEVCDFLRVSFNIYILCPSDERYVFFIRHIVKDSSKNYKRLKIKKK